MPRWSWEADSSWSSTFLPIANNFAADTSVLQNFLRAKRRHDPDVRFSRMRYEKFGRAAST